ncbi:MAG: PA2169 family four-helix-bundle protein [Planctomycetes bacterium]|nr:PA2169 family four-helix-bundle protein [Planctomycetota bacterium]MCB9920011.1 PA2169 family four-helix-bundle protein [Planctomycetota bacterium]
METKSNLESKTVDAAQELITINVDSYLGFTQAAETIPDPDAARLFRQIGNERREHCRELEHAIGAKPEDRSGTVKGTMHRWWLGVRSAMSTDERYAVLAEAERGEDAIKHRYEKLMKENAGNALSPVLHKQYAEVKKHHDLIRDLRDRQKAQ